MQSHFIDGQWVPACSGATLPVIDPATGVEFDRLARGAIAPGVASGGYYVPRDHRSGAGIWTRDGGRQIRVAKRMQCGQVYLNCYGAGGGVELPFGGVNGSGHGREKGFLALEEFSVVKTVVQYHGQ